MKVYQVTFTVRGIYADDENHALEQGLDQMIDGQSDVDVKQTSEVTA
jgi:hypothetical protein